MLFNSLLFVFFFAAVLAAYYTVPHRFRWMLLLIASFVFYAAWDARLIVLILFTTVVNFGVSMFFTRFPSLKRFFLWTAVIINFGLLVIFKYANFFGGIAGFFIQLLGFPEPHWEWHIILPLGISFYTFQAMSYTVDVYRETQQPERNFFKFSLYIAFFPQLVAGPIERAAHLLPQLFTEKRFKYADLAEGAQYVLLGFFKKLVIADRLAAAVNTVYNNPTHHAGLPSLIATVLFAFQIYCDFSGYSDIAVGCAKMLGIDLTRNFRQPYFSKSIKEFWRRWHVTLGSWFKDYTYIPLGGSRCSLIRQYANTLTVFLISGLWHGANFTFVVWGALHGLYQILGDITGRKWRIKKENIFINALKICFTFVLVCFAWIFFRANTTGDAFFIARHLLSDTGRWSAQYGFDVLNSMGLQLLEVVLGCMAIGLLVVLDFFAGNESVPHMLVKKAPASVRWVVYMVLAMAIASAGVFGNAAEFIYFQF
jgi:D-alanyl-lipoteichoic acid acyltransferase DltB (MBOAT superfamily)